MFKKLMNRFSRWCLKRAGIPEVAQYALLASDPVSALGAGASIIGGAMGSRSQTQAAQTAAAAQDQAAQLQRQTAMEALEMQREQFAYGQEADLYKRALAERQMQQQHQAYQDQFNFAAQQRDMSLQQLDYENQLRQAALGGLQPFADVGLGSLPGLTQMTGQHTMQIDPSLYGLAGMQQREATPIQGFDPTVGEGFAQSMRETLGQRHLSAAQQLDQQVAHFRDQLSAREATEIEGIMERLRKQEAEAEAARIRQEAEQRQAEIERQLELRRQQEEAAARAEAERVRQAQAQAAARAQVQPERVDLPASAGMANITPARPQPAPSMANIRAGAPAQSTATTGPVPTAPLRAPVSAVPQTLAPVQPAARSPAPAPTPATPPTPKPAPTPAATPKVPVEYKDAGITAAQLIKRYGVEQAPRTVTELRNLGYTDKQAINLARAVQQRQRIHHRSGR